MTNPITAADIARAAQTLTGLIRPTAIEASPSLSTRLGVPVHLKLEHQQITGSFKFRGASNAVAHLSPAERAAGVIGVSTGNHGRGLARACADADVRCVIAMSELVPQNKIDGIRAEGAEVLIEGRSQDEAQKAVDRRVAGGMTMIPPFDHPHIIAGQGTLGLEIANALPDVKTVLVQLSGGGLIAGMALALKSRLPQVRVIGVCMERGAAMQASLAAGHPVDVTEEPTLADSLGGGIGLDNRFTFQMVRDLVDDVILLTEAEIAAGIRHCYWQERQIVEGSGAVGVAAILAGKVTAPDGPVLALLSGQNIDMGLHHRIISGEDVDIAKDTA
ncbi:hydroxyectoine utilization dehydratase EutB [Pseudoruegeria sp. SK021]|uniref:hydroxyectoine utilization dehydratase EutB n=1 Tax=Pseudoruegeria sp. SK021 TaxID=1933035 RepID=UPI000A256FB0|nr:hydroxyectoine utilization dehydratase EutB [Pseudoruegeria sp. SK021]